MFEPEKPSDEAGGSSEAVVEPRVRSKRERQRRSENIPIKLTGGVFDGQTVRTGKTPKRLELHEEDTPDVKHTYVRKNTRAGVEYRYVPPTRGPQHDAAWVDDIPVSHQGVPA